MESRWSTGRTEAFSDGVIAIAITLLVLEISVPESAHGDLWKGIAHEWPSYLAYATSFLTIGGIWLIHHGIFRRLRYVDGLVMRLNLLLLMFVAFLPFPTKLMAESIHSRDAERAAVIFYGAALLVISALISAIWRAAAAKRELLHAEMTDSAVTALLRATDPNVAFYVVATGVALLAPRVAAFGYLAIAIVVVLRVRGDEPVNATATEP